MGASVCCLIPTPTSALWPLCCVLGWVSWSWWWVCIYPRIRVGMPLDRMAPYWKRWRRRCIACSFAMAFLPLLFLWWETGMLMWATVGVALLLVPWRAIVVVRQGSGGIQFCGSLAVVRWHRRPVGRRWIGLVPSLAGSCLMAVALLMDRVC